MLRNEREKTSRQEMGGKMTRLWHRTAAAIITASLVLLPAGISSDFVQGLLDSMTVEDKVGQMSQIDLNLLLVDVDEKKGSKVVSIEKADYYIGQLGVGSVFNSPLNIKTVVWDALEWRENIKIIQDAAKKHDRPPVLIGIDSIHGANYVFNAVLLPQPINLAATFDPQVAYFAGKIASRESRAAGFNWIFAPVLGLALQPLWARVYETYGEDPLLVSLMGIEHIRGIQEPDEKDTSSRPTRAAACAKHFVAYSMPRTGHDRTPAWIPERHVQQYFIPSFRAAIQKANVLTVMSSYSEYDGVPMTANRHTLTDILRGQLGFQGMLVTDFSEIINLQTWHKVASDIDDAVKLSLSETSVDMSMIPFDVESFRQSVLNALNATSAACPSLPVSRIDQSVRRILELKETLHMFNESIEFHEIHDVVGLSKDRKLALQMARESLVLAKNTDATLPIQYGDEKKGQRKKTIFITGPTSDSLAYLSGGWTLEWQGAENDAQFTYGTTILAAFVADDQWIISSSCGVDILGQDCGKLSTSNAYSTMSSIDEAAFVAKEADYSIICIGEENYAEKPGDLNRELSLPKGQHDLVQAVSNATKENGGKVILIFVGGRPRLLQDMVAASDAIIIAFLPGPDGGRAIADVIAGAYNPSGRLPITYPKFGIGGGYPYFHAVSDMCTIDTIADGIISPFPHHEYALCQVEWPFGHGLSYTSFQYSDINVSTDVLRLDDDLTLSVTVTNIGTLAGADTVLFFSFDQSRRVTPEYKRLRAFEKVELGPNESKSVVVSISLNDLRFIGPHDDTHLILQQGKTTFFVGVGSETDCRISGTANKTCSKLITIDTGDQYVDFCEAACNVWQESGCEQEVSGFDTDTCSYRCFMDAGTNTAWGWNYVNCIENVRRQIFAGENTCEGMLYQCRNVLIGSSYFTFIGEENSKAVIWFSFISGFIGIFIISYSLIILPPQSRKQSKSRVQLMRPSRPLS